jgi:serine protease Do
MIAGRSAKLLSIGLAAIGVGVLAAGLSLQAPAPANPPPQAITPRQPLVPSREAVRQAAGLSDAFIAIADAVTPAVVRIQAERTSVPAEGSWLPRGLQDFFGAPDSGTDAVPQLAGGTGFVVSENGYILTNNHVIDGAERITVALRDKRLFPAQVIGRDPTTDVAVIKVDSDGLPAVRLGDSDLSRVGEWVIAIGNPGFDEGSTLDFTVTSGIISAKGRPLNIIPQGLRETDPTSSLFAIEDFIQTDAVINPGNSGGPLIDLEGSVIGMNTAIASTTGFHQGYGFAIPANLARRVMMDLIEHGHVQRALLGISIADIGPEDAEVYSLPSISGVLVEDFAEDSPARDAGVQRHDVIVGVDGGAVDRVGELQRRIAQHQPGEEVTLAVMRYGQRREFRVTLAQAPIPEFAPAGPASGAPAGAQGIGLELADLTPATARRWGFDRAGGVVVTGVRAFSAADRRRVAEGHRLLAINRREPDDAREAKALLRAIPSGRIASLLLERPEGTTYIANVRIP